MPIQYQKPVRTYRNLLETYQKPITNLQKSKKPTENLLEIHTTILKPIRNLLKLTKTYQKPTRNLHVKPQIYVVPIATTSTRSICGRDATGGLLQRGMYDPPRHPEGHTYSLRDSLTLRTLKLRVSRG